MLIKNSGSDVKYSSSEYKAITGCDEIKEIASIGNQIISVVHKCKLEESIAN